MSLDFTTKKLREARFFLTHLQREARRTVGEFEQFDFYLSAFLSAGRSVTFVLQNEDKEKYKAWYPSWEQQLPSEDREVFQYMNRQRVEEVHKRGAERELEEEGIPIHGVYQDEFGRYEVFTPPAAITGIVGPPATIYRPVRYFRINGDQHEVIEVCSRYTKLLETLMQEFVEAHKT